ncbi:MAG: Ribosomal subunit interface protein [Candidatus Bipolaricaulis sibiricus]|uniref:Ribosomal subunit interface protein n=1 Tax=Bipolaricaulis sibiricus TaxID=2501609 RepID=A0A410FTR1_BIPS1|nr:MAG: Ribosomal subunit interface protein [Candidatus Bipolaricaulis sibiricus]
MRLHVEERYASDSDALTKYVEKKVETLSRYFDRILKLDVILEVEGPAQRVQMMGYLVNHKVVKAKVETNDMYASIDQAVDKMQRQLVRYKERLRVSRKTGHAAPPATGGRRATPGPQIERVDEYIRQPLTPEAAVRELERSGRDFVVFFQADDDQPAVLFHRGDGRYGLVVPRR